jgi:hypothetical protein
LENEEAENLSENKISSLSLFLHLWNGDNSGLFTELLATDGMEFPRSEIPECSAVQKPNHELGVVLHAYNPSTQEAEAGRSQV